MTTPVPRGRFSQAGEPSAADKEIAERTFKKLQTLMAAGKLPSGRLTQALPGGGAVIAFDMGGIKKTIIVPPETEEKRPELDGRVHGNIPMLFSGDVKKPVVRDGAGVGLRLTEQCRKRLAGYGDDDPPARDVALQRFRCDYNVRLDEFKPPPGAAFHSQYSQLVPSWYAQPMGEVVQIVLGYGRQDFDKLPEDRLERAQMILPERVLRAAGVELGGAHLPGCLGVPHQDGQVRYDYKPYTNNLVAFDKEMKPWLLRVSAAGVYAMPLPVVPVTTTRAFAEYMQEVGDTEILKILERFGGMPTGETFPADQQDFEAWRRAGVIIKVCDASDFYTHAMMYVGCGWATNTLGTEGINTCYDYDNGIPYGLAYKMRLSLGAAKRGGYLKKEVKGDTPLEQEEINAYMSSLWREVGNAADHRRRAIRYKILNAEVSTLRAAMAAKHGIDWWENLEGRPIAQHAGSITQVSRGWLYHPANFYNQPQIKFPDPYEQACISHDFGRLKGALRPTAEAVRTTGTIMFGYYVEDDLKVVKYVYDPTQQPPQTSKDNFEECMFIGAWEKEERWDVTGMHGHFYTSDFDEREARAGSVKTTNIRSKPIGYDGPNFCMDDIFYGTGWLFRNRWFYVETDTRSTGGFGKNIATCVPYYCRGALLHAWTRVEWDVRTTYSAKNEPLGDPHRYRYWTYQRHFWWRQGVVSPKIGKPEPDPNTGQPVWAEYEDKSEGLCSEHADTGPWMEGFPKDVTSIVHPDINEYVMTCWFSPNTPRWKEVIEFEGPTIETTASLDLSFPTTPVHLHKEPHPHYFESSPTEYGMTFYRLGAKLVFGEREYMMVDEDWSQGYSALLDERGDFPRFIGVVNE